jgi:DNA-binding MurR/RpiR family transcriptional regulator
MAKLELKVIHNSLGCGDYIRVVDQDGVLWYDSHRITPADLVFFINQLGFQAELVEVTDEEMEEL